MSARILLLISSIFIISLGKPFGGPKVGTFTDAIKKNMGKANCVLKEINVCTSKSKLVH